jgi:hypothetical protein
MMISFRTALDSVSRLKDQEDLATFKINVGVFFCSMWIFQELKSHPLFKNLHFYTLALNDKLREYPMLTVMEQYGENSQEWD